MTTALAGVRVVELASGPVTGLATMALADFGADVVVIDRPGHDPLRELPAARMWRRGKQVLALDVHQQREELDTLLAGTDVLVVNWRRSSLTRHGLDFASLHARFPHLIYCHVSGFGNEGPLADVPGYEHVVAAAVGRMLGFSGIVDRDGPVFSALQVGTHASAQYALSSMLAALLARGDDGSGRLVETSLLQGLLPYEQGPVIGRQFPDQFGDIYAAGRSPEPPLPSLYYHPAQAGDGRWMQFGNLLPHLFDNFLLVTGLMDVIADPDWNGAQMMLPPPKHEEFRARMLHQIQERPAADWVQDCIDNGGVVATAYQSTQEAMVDPDIVANGHVITAADGSRQLGPLARLTQTPADPLRPTRVIAGADVPGWSPRPAPARQTNGLPLAGIRIVEIATIIAAPMSASLLADMGAEVIKVEQVGGDPYRGLGRGVGSARVNAGKRSISVNLKSEAGREIVMKLLADADVMIHNYRPGVPERLGIGYEQVAAINPGLVYLQSNGYGPDGPGAQRPSTHPIPGAAMGGVVYQMGGGLPRELLDVDDLRRWTSRIMRANEVNPDPNTAMVIMSSVLLGLNARTRTGTGQRILVDMFGANAWANFDDFVSYDGKPERAPMDALAHGLGPTYRLYRCADESWIFLGLVHDHERRRFAQVLGENSIAAPEAEAIVAADETLSDALATMFRDQPADTWEALLAGAGLGCVRADRNTPPEFWLQHEQAAAMHLTQSVTHPAWGSYQRHGAGVTFDGHQPPLAPPPLAGQHGAELLAALGYDPDTIRALADKGVTWQESTQ